VLEKTITVKTGLVVSWGHWKWHHSNRGLCDSNKLMYKRWALSMEIITIMHLLTDRPETQI